MRTKVTFPVSSYAVALVICGTACSGNEHGLMQQMNQPSSETRIETRTEGELSLDVGGAMSKEFKHNLKYHALKVTIVAGTNSVSGQRGKDLAADKFIVGIESTQGKAILQILNAEQPWRWEGLTAIPFANALYFNGKIGGKSWRYVSVYPDKKLESLLTQLRKQLERQ